MERNTAQKLKILEYLRKVKSHPTAEMVYEEVRKELPTISLATVYRNLNLLTDKGDILRVKLGKEYRYDGDTSLHQHLHCRECDRIYDGHQKKINEDALKRFSSKEFSADDVRIIFEGTCNSCGVKR